MLGGVFIDNKLPVTLGLDSDICDKVAKKNVLDQLTGKMSILYHHGLHNIF